MGIVRRMTYYMIRRDNGFITIPEDVDLWIQFDEHMFYFTERDSLVVLGKMPSPGVDAQQLQVKIDAHRPFIAAARERRAGRNFIKSMIDKQRTTDELDTLNDHKNV